MTRSAGISVENNFTKGLITEVTGVNSPENSVSHSVNIVYDRRGRAHSRNSLNYEEQYGLTTLETEGARSEFVWDSSHAGYFIVLQVGHKIYFYEKSDNKALSDNKLPFEIDLRVYKTPQSTDVQVSENRVAFATGKGYLFIAHPRCDPIYVKRTDTFVVDKITVKIRDFGGVDDGLAPDEAPTTLSEAHKYNLLNQGWWESESHGDRPNPVRNVLAMVRSPWPTNSTRWQDFMKLHIQDGIERFWPGGTDSKGSTSLLPKGHFIFDAFNIDRNGSRGKKDSPVVSGLQPETTNGERPSCVSFFMGRVFFSGVNADGFKSNVYYSQIIEGDTQLGLCYQVNDPTHKDFFDLVASDGGVAKILDLGRVFDMKTYGKAVYIFADNGVWTISGSDTTPFSATDYTVNKISSTGVVSPASIVEVGDTPIWWNYEGIFTIGRDESGFSQTVKSLSESTIQTFYEDIGVNSILSAKGAYNDQEGLIYWLYSSEGITDDFDSVLVFDVVSAAFYPLTFDNTNHKISGIFSSRSVEKIFSYEGVYTTDGEDVTDINGALITLVSGESLRVSSKYFKLVTQERVSNRFTFSDFSRSSQIDWVDTFPAGFNTEFITGYRIRGELMKKFQTNYLTVITESTDWHTEECFIQGIWDYRTSNLTGRFTNPQQIYQYMPLTKYQRRRLRIRGNGYSLQFKFYGTPGKPFIIIGWAGFETANTIP